jgi:hypothetical protein
MTAQQDDPESRPGASHATVFVWLFAVSAIWHYASSGSEIENYWFRYDPLVTPLIFLSIVTAFIAACYPNKTIAVIVMCVSQLIAISLRLPFVADHLVMEFFLNMSILGAFLYSPYLSTRCLPYSARSAAGCSSSCISTVRFIKLIPAL